MAKAKGRARLFQDPDENTAKDYDPEADGQLSDDGSVSASSGDENAGTEHYAQVGKSKLRQRESVSLGPKYRGTRVSRHALADQDDAEEEDDDEMEEEEDEYDDPEAANLGKDTELASDSEIESDDALGESDDDKLNGFVFRGSSRPKKESAKKGSRATAADFMSSDEEEDMDGLEDESDSVDDDDMDDGLDDLVNGSAYLDDEAEETGDDDELDEDSAEDSGVDEQDEEEDEDDSEDEVEPQSKAQDARPNLGALSNSADVAKGTAIQQQRKVYDGLLNLRIRLQKALVAANTFTVVEDAEAEITSEPYEAAEEAAIKLLNTISGLRQNFGSSAKTGEKRKREVDVSMTNEQIWEQLQDVDASTAKFREDRLEKWSRKVQSVNVTANRGLGAKPKSLVDSLQEQLTNPENRLVKRTRVPRSCAPAQAAKKMTEDEAIYDDADFYQLLLKDLVDQRTVESSSAQTTAVPSVMLTAAKEAKTRKNVDRKASKGRKMRFTVHEKLQNFMAPEDRRSWEQGAIDRFFGALFGRRLQLDEEESDGSDDGLEAEEAGLRLFRS